MSMINNNDLQKVVGGQILQLKQELADRIPLEVQEKLNLAKGDVEVCRILAENGIGLEELEVKIKDSFKKIGKDVLALSDQQLENTVGGFEDGDYGGEVQCECGNKDRKQFSYQFWASMLNSGNHGIYRCKKCNLYTVITGKGSLHYFDKEYLDTHFYK